VFVPLLTRSSANQLQCVWTVGRGTLLRIENKVLSGVAMATPPGTMTSHYFLPNSFWNGWITEQTLIKSCNVKKKVPIGLHQTKASLNWIDPPWTTRVSNIRPAGRIRPVMLFSEAPDGLKDTWSPFLEEIEEKYSVLLFWRFQIKWIYVIILEKCSYVQYFVHYMFE